MLVIVGLEASRISVASGAAEVLGRGVSSLALRVPSVYLQSTIWTSRPLADLVQMLWKSALYFVHGALAGMVGT